jgi:RNA polymerase sigma-70 factor (ECF subfamily)
VGITPSQPVAISPSGKIADGPAAVPTAIPEALFEALWQESEAAACGLERAEFVTILISAAAKQNFGQPAGAVANPEQQAACLRSLRVADLALARGCAQGNEPAWERFLTLYRQPLTRAAIAITGNDTQGRELADALYAELYGLNLRDGQRRSPLDSYQGRGSLIGWLRTTIAQRHVDHHRKTWREEQLPDVSESAACEPAAAAPEPAASPQELTLLAAAIQHCLTRQSAEDRFLLIAYYLDQRTLLQIARTLNVHEATVSRKLRRSVEDLRKALLRNLEERGLSKRAAKEALGVDPRDLTGRNELTGMSDLDLHLKKLLQISQSGAFPEKAGL